MRLAVSALLLVVALGSAGALAAWGWQRGEGADAAFHVQAIGPEGIVLDATVQLEDATALRALEVAAQGAGVALDLVRYPGMGVYVRAIAGHEAAGASGWIYEVERDGAWVSGDRSAELYPLQKGDALRWSWTAG